MVARANGLGVGAASSWADRGIHAAARQCVWAELGCPAVPAKSTDWATKPAPGLREELGYQAHFDDAQAEKILEGLVPAGPEDQWFVYADAGWVYLHRSSTGVLVYAVRLDGSPSGVRVVESWVNRDPDQYGEADLAYDRALLDYLVRTLLLGERAELPHRARDERNL